MTRIHRHPENNVRKLTNQGNDLLGMVMLPAQLSWRVNRQLSQIGSPVRAVEATDPLKTFCQRNGHLLNCFAG
jgi:hypothetical protein